MPAERQVGYHAAPPFSSQPTTTLPQACSQAMLWRKAEEIEARYRWRLNLRGEGDNFIVEIAMAAWPCTIVTHNIGDVTRAELRFPQIAVRTPGQLMQSIQHVPLPTDRY